MNDALPLTQMKNEKKCDFTHTLTGYETDLSTKNYPTMCVGKKYAVVLMPLIHCCDFDFIHFLISRIC